MSSKQVDSVTCTVLSKGLNFAVTPSTIPYKDMLRGVKTALTDLPQAEAEDIRSDVVRLLKTIEPAKPNITWQERITLKEILNDDDMVILKADKFNASVIIAQNCKMF